VDELLKHTIAKHIEANGSPPTMDIARRYQSGVYAMWKGDFGLDEPEGVSP
jgi:hypothetical protein